MDSLLELLSTTNSVAHSIFTIALVPLFGLLLGKVKIKGIGLGIGGVMFAGIIVSAAGVSINHEILEFLRDFGLVLFVYMIGLQVGPSFAGTIKSQGLSLCLLALIVVALGALTASAFVLLGIVPLSAAVGILAGATTNTPSLGAAREALLTLSPEAIKIDPTLGYAISYPFGILGTILVVTFAKFIFKNNSKNQALTSSKENETPRKSVSSVALEVENENLVGLSFDEIPAAKDLGIVVSRVLRAGIVTIPTNDLKIELGDIFLAVGEDRSLKALELIVGKISPVNIKEIPSKLTIKHLAVTSPEAVGKTFAQIKASERFDLSITRIRRGDVEFAATDDVHLNLGDMVRAVGDEHSVKRLAKKLGDSQQQLQHFQFFPVFVGIVLGVILGNMSWHIPFLSAPLKLGLAGGPLLASLFMSRYANHPKFTTYVPYGANLALRELGIVLFLSCVGLKAGEQFFEILFSSMGLTWLLTGAAITLFPLLVLLMLASRESRKLSYLSFTGLCAGSMTDPPALAFATALDPSSNAPAVAYATVYPFVMLLRILFAQILVLVIGSM